MIIWEKYMQQKKYEMLYFRNSNLIETRKKKGRDGKEREVHNLKERK